MRPGIVSSAPPATWSGPAWLFKEVSVTSSENKHWFPKKHYNI
jgi:hypothetical protein